MKTTLFILLTIIISVYSDNVRDNTKICNILHMIQSQECKDTTSTFCQYVDEIEQKLCPDNLIDDTLICDILHIIQSQECKDTTLTFCQYLDEIEQKLCPDNLVGTDWACKYRNCPPDTPYCKNGQCFDKPTNSTKPVDYGCKYRQLYNPCPKDKPYCKNGKCFDKPQNITRLIK